MNKFRKILSLTLCILMLFSVCGISLPVVAASVVYEAPVYTEEELRSISEQYDYALTDEEIAAILNGETTLSDVVAGREEDVTVIVQLSAEGILNTVENAVSDGELSTSAEWAQYRMEKNQESVQNRIEKNVFDGEDVEVLYSYTLITNAFAITAKKSRIDEIAAVHGVESVYTAPVYSVVPTSAEEEAGLADNYFTGSDNTTAYDGSGTTIAIIDTGLDLTHEAFVNEVSNAKLDKSDISAVLENINAYKNTTGMTVDNFYHSSKVPFVFNYADTSLDVSHNNDDQTDHGTHVAGIAAGYAVDAEGKVVFEGVAPEAQVVVLKVFGKKRAGNAADIMAAVEDAVTLGVDVINLSLGSWGGFTYAGDYPKVEAVYQSAAQAGIVVACAAGNDYSAAYGSLYGNDLALASNPDNGIINSPASYDDNLAVASVASNKYMGRFLSVGGRKITYTNNATDASRNIEKYLGETVQYAVLQDSDGNMLTGKSADFKNYAAECGVAGKIVVVRRGAIFTETVSHAQAAGAIGLIVCDHSEGSLITMAENDSVSIPALFISKADGDFLHANVSTDNNLFVAKDASLVENLSKGTMSEFSSWGVTADLKLKPEITGYGGVVYSTRNNGEYGLMSGTSMASPYLAGVAALIAQKYAVDHAGDEQAMKQARKNYATSVMMSTAVPVVEKETGVRYSPRKQGAGLVNIDAALSSLAHITVDGSVTPKIDMGDDKAKTGVYTLSFNVVNDSAMPLTFKVNATVQTEQVTVQDVSYLTQRIDSEKADAFIETGINYVDAYADRVYYTDELKDIKFMSGLPYDLTDMSTVVVDAAENRIVVPANETVSVTVTVTLGEEAKTYMDANFENGIYVEGFIMLTSETEGQPDLTVPYMGFYGDWTMAPALDEGTWDDIYSGRTVYPQMDVSTGVSIYDGSNATVATYINYPLGFASKYITSPFELYANGITYQSAVRNTFGGETGLHFDAIGAELALLRNAKTIRYTVTDVETGKVYATESRDYVRKSYYYSDSVGVINGGYFHQDQFGFDGIDQTTGKEIPDGTTVRYDVEVFLDYGEEDEQNNKRNTFSFVATYDTTPPEVTGMDVYIDSETDELLLDVATTDAGCLSVIWYIVVGYEANGAYTHAEFREAMPGGGTVGEGVATLNLTKACEQANIDTLRCVLIWQIADLNDMQAQNDDPCFRGDLGEASFYLTFYDNLKLTCSAGVMSVGQTKNVDFNKTFALGYRDEKFINQDSANNNQYGIFEDYFFTSSDPDIASVDMSGRVTAKSPGYATITVRTEFGKAEASCRIRVIDNVLQDQIDATPEGGTLVVQDGDLTESVTIEKDIILDLNGSTLTGADGSPAIRVTNGQVTVTNGTVLTQLSKHELADPVLLDILKDNIPAIKVAGGEVTLDNVTVKGATATYGGTTFTAGSAVKLTNGAELYLNNANLYGLYAVNNTDSEEAKGGSITIASGHLEGLLGSITTMENVYGADGSVFVDTTNLLAGESASYLGTEEGVAFEQALMSSLGYVVSARELANADVVGNMTISYDEEKDCAVVTYDASSSNKINVATTYLALNKPIDADKYKTLLVTYNWTAGSKSTCWPYVAVDPSLVNNVSNNSQYGVGTYVCNNEKQDVFNALNQSPTEWKGSADTFCFWPLARRNTNPYITTPFTITTRTEIEFYQLIFFENAAQAANYTVATNLASTNNLFVANAQTYNTKFSYDNSVLSVNVVLDDVSDDTYNWIPTNLSLYVRTHNADGTDTDTLVGSNAVSLDANGEINTAFTVSDPDAEYVVKCDFDLVFTADSTAALYTAEETQVAAFAGMLSAMINEAFLFEELEASLTDVVDFMLYDMREGFAERDALHIDCPLRQTLVPEYHPDYPDMIGQNKTDDPTWVAMWDRATLPVVINTYLLRAATILGDTAMKELMAELQDSLPAATWNSLHTSYRTGDYGAQGVLPQLYASLAQLDALAANVNNRAQLSALLTQLATSIVSLSENLTVFTSAVMNLTDTVAITEYISASGFTTSLINHAYFGCYNERQTEFSACLTALDAYYEPMEQVAGALKYAMTQTGLFSALVNYEDTANADALLSVYFDGTATENGSYATGISSTFEMNANYDGYISYVLNGGKNAKENPNGYTVAQPVVLAEPTRTGYTFDGWYTTADFAQGTRITATDTATSGDLVLYAKWNVNTYTITFMVNDDVLTTESFAFNSAIAATEEKVNVPGYVFNYWYEDYPHNAYSFGTMPASDIVLHANLDYISLQDIELIDGVYTWQYDDNTPVRLVIDRSCTIDFNGKTITNMDDLAALLIENRATVTIKNAVIAPQVSDVVSAENCSVLVTENSKVTFENCYILGAKDAQNTAYVGNAVDVEYGNVTLKNSVLCGMYAVKNTKGDGVYYDCHVDVENSILLGVAATVSQPSVLHIAGTQLNADQLLTDASQFAAARLVAAFNEPAFTWEYKSAYAKDAVEQEKDVLTVNAPSVTYTMPDGSVVVFTAAKATADGTDKAFADEEVIIEIPADPDKYNHSVAVSYACSVSLADTMANNLLNNDAMVMAAMQNEIEAFDSLVAKYNDLLATWANRAEDIKAQFYRFDQKPALKIYLNNIRNRLARIGGSAFTGQQTDGEGLALQLEGKIEAYTALSDPLEKFGWLMLNKTEVISMTVEMDDNFNSIYADCVSLNGLSQIYEGVDYTTRLGYVEEVCNRSNVLRYEAEYQPAIAQNEYMAAADRTAFAEEMLSADIAYVTDGAVDASIADSVILKESFATYTVVYELYDEYLDETTKKIFVIMDGDDVPEYTPEAADGRSFSGWTQAPVQFPITKITYTGSLLKDSYTITFKAEGSEDIVRTVKYGDTLSDIPEVPARAHYDQTAPYWDVTSFEGISSDITVNAVYTPNVYTVTFKAEGSEDVVKTVKYGDTLTGIPAVPAREHYNQTAPKWDVTSFEGISSDITVNAVYTPNVYTVTFKAEGSEDIVKTVIYGNDLTDIPAVPAREHYNQTVPKWDVTSFEGISSDITVNAVYTANTYIVTWNVEGVETSESYVYNTTPVYTGELAKACDIDVYYVFNAWTPAVTPAAGDITYTATFTAVAKDRNDVEIPANLTATYGSTLAGIVLPKGFVWKDATQSVGNVGVNSFTAVYTPQDTEHYLVEEISVQVTVIKADPTVVVPTVDVVTGHKLSEFALPAGFAWADGNAILGAAGTATCKAVYTPADTANYNTIEVDVTVSVVIPAQYCAVHGHDYSGVRVVAPTCTKDGYTVHTCAMCGNEYSDSAVNKLGHKYKDTVVAPTCTAQGYTTHTCSVCGDSYNDTFVSAKGHKYTDAVRTEPTCTEKGVRVYTCSDCSHSYTEAIPALGHTDNDADGYCDRCEYQICDHACHKSGIAGFFWKIIRVFNKLFKKNQFCECGHQHW